MLCIDNEPQILDGMRVLLGGWGCEVLTAESLAGPLDADPLAAAGPDAIIVDYHLDDGTGIDAVFAARSAFGAGLPALLVTADRSPEVRAAAERDGIALQNKPVKPAPAGVADAAVDQRKGGSGVAGRRGFKPPPHRSCRAGSRPGCGCPR